MAAITLPGENLIASKQAKGETLNVDRVVLANIPGLNPEDPVDREQQLPPKDQIVFDGKVSQTGYINPNLVVYSLIMGTGGESFKFNWMGLYSSVDDVVVLISYAPTQSKDPSVAMTRNFMMEFSGASETTDIHIDAESWQVDYSARTNGIDERARKSNEDVFGRQLFFGDTCKVVADGGEYYKVLAGEKAYVAGIEFGFEGKRILIDEGDLPTSVWVDVSQKGNAMSDIQPVIEVVVSNEDLIDHVDNDGVFHYLEKIAIFQDNILDVRQYTEQGTVIRKDQTQPVTYSSLSDAASEDNTNREYIRAGDNLSSIYKRSSQQDFDSVPDDERFKDPKGNLFVIDSRYDTTFKTIATLKNAKGLNSGDAICLSERANAKYIIENISSTHLSGDIVLNIGKVARLQKTDSGAWFLEHFGAVKSGTISASPALDMAVQRGVEEKTQFTIELGSGRYLFDAPADLSHVVEEFAIRGKGRRLTYVDINRFGASEIWLKLPEGKPCFVAGFTVGDGEPNGQTGQHPIAIYAPRAGRLSLDDIGSSSYWNTVIWCSRPYNCDWGTIDLFFSGYQPIHREINSTQIKVSTTEGSPVITSNEALFKPEDVGRNIYIQRDNPVNATYVSSILSIESETQATLSDHVNFTGTNRRLSFGAVTGSTEKGSGKVKLTSDVLTPEDVGRFIYIEFANKDKGLLISKIKSVDSASEMTLEDEAVVSLPDVVIHFSPSVVLSGYEATGSTPINDLVISSLLIEGYRGAGMIARGGTHLYLNNLKTHGRPSSEYSNFGLSGRSVIWSSTNRSVVNVWEHEFCHGQKGKAAILISGNRPLLEINGLTVNSMSTGDQYLIEFDPADTDTSGLHLDNVQSTTNWDNVKGLYLAGTRAAKRLVFGSGAISGTNSSMRSVQTPALNGSSRAFIPTWIENNSVISFKPATPIGFLSIAAEDSGSCSTIAYFRTHNSSMVESIDYRENRKVETTTGPLNGQTGSSGVVTISADHNDGKIYIENRSGTGRRFYIGMLG